METMHSKITDYWDERAKAIDSTSRALLVAVPRLLIARLP